SLQERIDPLLHFEFAQGGGGEAAHFGVLILKGELQRSQRFGPWTLTEPLQGLAPGPCLARVQLTLGQPERHVGSCPIFSLSRAKGAVRAPPPPVVKPLNRGNEAVGGPKGALKQERPRTRVTWAQREDDSRLILAFRNGHGDGRGGAVAGGIRTAD